MSQRQCELDSAVKNAIAGIADDAWQTIKSTDPNFDEDTGRWRSSAEVAEIEFAAFKMKKSQQAPAAPSSVAPRN